MFAYRYDESFYYSEQQECQLDPLESEMQKKEIYLLPANCTWEKPLNEKEGYRIKWDGSAWVYELIPVPPAPVPPTLEKVKASKIFELKGIRDTKEVEDILVNGHLYDYDDKARERINAAIIALDVSGGSIMWTLADNTDTEVTATDLKYVIAMVAQRSNALHMKYRTLKKSVENAQSKEEVEAINWED